MNRNNEELNQQDIKRLLDQSLTRIERPTLARLHHAREQALARHSNPCTDPVLVRAGHAIWQIFGTQYPVSRLLAAALLLVAILFSISAYWNQDAKLDSSDIDIAILTDDIPIHYFVD
ncbi:DUF3619 family protein [Candidatus Nitrotoga fabula]|uniref:DUF3619 family protein n=1 Tax=Candidatus Nitrotoga fabula TaxID=2182327 RepID=A0A916BDB3_9PROT|nr:DUF3619 family protein [Candidatus Nitrotoga fabula]CAE6730250.1 conserved hypothetical protein [Candidatus Nitrotoga fabula]